MQSIEDVESFVWVQESLKLVEKQGSYGGLKVKNGGIWCWPDFEREKEISFYYPGFETNQEKDQKEEDEDDDDDEDE
ncbi:hypothetical protein E3N88_01259 [Mikania micrantha]|uniref:Uncharacterized protein n=1 Tax=Mikania micrantha TaxID=192012 RepID=A0A5N6Q150_9ASTR|nr:hypothetical protein E3N88_01259 [Mikania micrantha]